MGDPHAALALSEHLDVQPCQFAGTAALLVLHYFLYRGHAFEDWVAGVCLGLGDYRGSLRRGAAHFEYCRL